MRRLKTLLLFAIGVGIGYVLTLFHVSYSMRTRPDDWADSIIRIKDEQNKQQVYGSTD